MRFLFVTMRLNWFQICFFLLTKWKYSTESGMKRIKLFLKITSIIKTIFATVP